MILSFFSSLRLAHWMVVIGTGAIMCPVAVSAQSFTEGAVPDPSRERALTCMTQAIAYEAGFEPLSGKRAVAEIILNRTRSPGFPASVCGVVYQNSSRGAACQFTFTCDGSLRRPLPDGIMAQARVVASAALDNLIPLQLDGALNYHADYVLPYWAATMVRVTKIGRHIFYRPPGTALTSKAYLAVAEPMLPGGKPGDGASPDGSSRGDSLAAPVGFSMWGLAVPAIGTP